MIQAFGTGILAASVIALVAAAAPQQTGWQAQQGWNGDERERWYGAPQGSRLIPWAWFAALEQPASTAKFLDTDYLASFGYLPGGPRGMPIGFAVDERSDSSLRRTKLRWYAGQGAKEGWVGLTCAACHTGAVEFGGQSQIIDGGQSMGDYQQLVAAVRAALEATAKDAGKWDRFSRGVLGGRYNQNNNNRLRGEFAKLLAWERTLAQANETDSRYGYGRVDAFGHIYNKVALAVDASDPETNPPDAPVSYPHLWGIHGQTRIQWNGSAENTPLRNPLIKDAVVDMGALGRNAGEVIGVFGEARPAWGGTVFRSSVDFDNLNRIETQLRKLKAPAWPGFMPRIDPAAAAAGGKLYDGMCKDCHVRPGIDTPVVARPRYERISLFRSTGADRADTDPRMACNAYLYSAPSGVLKGSKVTTVDPATGATREVKLGYSAPIGSMLPLVVIGAIKAEAPTVASLSAKSLFGVVPPPATTTPILTAPRPGPWLSAPAPTGARQLSCMTDVHPNLGYKARPLDGIWALPPYLHNGSVPTLWELLKPSARRSTFWVGGRAYDTRWAGYIADQDQQNRFMFDTRLPGNGNRGHDYGAEQLSDIERSQLIEYLKTL